MLPNLSALTTSPAKDGPPAKRARTLGALVLPSLKKYDASVTQDKLPPFQTIRFPIRTSAEITAFMSYPDPRLIESAQLTATSLVPCLHWSTCNFETGDKEQKPWDVGDWVTSWSYNPSKNEWSNASNLNTVQFHTDPSWQYQGTSACNQSLLVLYVAKDDVQQDIGLLETERTRSDGTKIRFGVVVTNVFGFVFKKEVFEAYDKQVTAFHVMQTHNDRAEVVRYKYDVEAVLEAAEGSL